MTENNFGGRQTALFAFLEKYETYPIRFLGYTCSRLPLSIDVSEQSRVPCSEWVGPMTAKPVATPKSEPATGPERQSTKTNVDIFGEKNYTISIRQRVNVIDVVIYFA